MTFKTQYRVQKGFYMHKNMFLMISKDKTSQEYWLELFLYNKHNENEKSTVDLIKLFKSTFNVEIKYEFDK